MGFLTSGSILSILFVVIAGRDSGRDNDERMSDFKFRTRNDQT
jgi:hypothetical protein